MSRYLPLHASSGVAISPALAISRATYRRPGLKRPHPAINLITNTTFHFQSNPKTKLWVSNSSSQDAVPAPVRQLEHFIISTGLSVSINRWMASIYIFIYTGWLRSRGRCFSEIFRGVHQNSADEFCRHCVGLLVFLPNP